jgi:meprin A
MSVIRNLNNACQYFTELNAKGAILHAFEMFRLKSCVDFKPYEGESSYIIFQKLSGLV